MKSVRSHPLAASALSFLFTLFATVTPPAGAIDLTGLDRGLTLAGHPDGGWLALSSDTLSATSDVVIEAVRIAPDGTVGPNFFTSELHPIEVNVEAAVVAPSGRWVAVWRSEDRDFENARFSATIFRPDGELVSALDLAVRGELFVSTDLRSAVAAIAPNGDFLIAWAARTQDTQTTSGTLFAADLFLARFSQDGDRVAGPVVVNQERVGLQLPRDMVADGDSVAITWASNCCVEDGGEYESHLRFLDPLSLSPKSDVVVVSEGPDDPRGAARALSFRSDGRLVVVSQGEAAPGGGGSPVPVIVFRTFGPDGTQAGPDRVADAALLGAPFRFAEATPDGMVWLVGWEEPDGPLLARLFTLDGIPIGPAHETGLHDGRDRFFTAASDPAGRLLVGYGEFLEPAVVAAVVGQAPPDDRALTSPELPGFRVWVLIGGGTPDPRWGAEEPMCLAETLCASGALPGRTEVLVRVVGPKPNDFLWPTLVKLSTSSIDVWIEQISTGEVQHYFLPGASPGNDVLNGLFDRTGFRP